MLDTVLSAATTPTEGFSFSARFDGESLFSNDYNAKLLKERMEARAHQLKGRTAIRFNEVERENLTRVGAITNNGAPNVAQSFQAKAGTAFRAMALRA